MTTPSRKLEHIDIVLTHSVEGPGSTWLEHVHLVHEAIPELDFDEVIIETGFLHKKLKAPLMITDMTGGHRDVEHVNRALAQAAEEMGIAMGGGVSESSDRGSIEDRELRSG